MKCLVVFLIVVFFQQETEATRVVWDNSVEFDAKLLDQRFSSRAEVVRIPNRILIFPGTKWCGAGNVADDYDDLGIFRELDKCCRAHDHCPDIISGWQTKYGLTNPVFWTRLNCTCDDEFYQCLKTVDDLPSKQVGNLYFNGLGTQCFKEDYPIVSCQDSVTIIPPFEKCLEYELDETQPKEYQWFDVPLF